jgi:hypothetical protein
MIIFAGWYNSALIYGPYAKGYESRLKILEQNRHKYISLLKDRFAGNGVSVVDLTDVLRTRVTLEPIAATELDYHLNARGVEIIFDVLQKAMSR